MMRSQKLYIVMRESKRGNLVLYNCLTNKKIANSITRNLSILHPDKYYYLYKIELDKDLGWLGTFKNGVRYVR